MNFCHLQKICLTKIEKIIGYRTRFYEICFVKQVNKTGEFLGNKIADVVTNSYDKKKCENKPNEEVFIPPEKREEILNELRQVL